MNLPISKLAQMYFALKAFENQSFENYKLSYRIFRNLELLRPIGERYMKEMQDARGEREMNDSEITQLDYQIFLKWEQSGETEELELKKLDFTGEKISMSPAQASVLYPIIENID